MKTSFLRSPERRLNLPKRQEMAYPMPPYPPHAMQVAPLPSLLDTVSAICHVGPLFSNTITVTLSHLFRYSVTPPPILSNTGPPPQLQHSSLPDGDERVPHRVTRAPPPPCRLLEGATGSAAWETYVIDKMVSLHGFYAVCCTFLTRGIRVDSIQN
jgi:hypothetical protein